MADYFADYFADHFGFYFARFFLYVIAYFGADATLKGYFMYRVLRCRCYFLLWLKEGRKSDKSVKIGKNR